MLNNIRERLNYFTKRKIAPPKLDEVRSGLLEESTLDINYVVLILGSCAIATFGLLSNSTAVIIGAMIIAPLLTVRSQKVLTPKQVRLLEKFVAEEMEQYFTLIFQVSQFEEVKREINHSSSEPKH